MVFELTALLIPTFDPVSSMVDLRLMSLATLARAIHKKEHSALEVTDAYLERIQRFNPNLNAYLAVLEEEARASARRVDEEIAQGTIRSPIHGVPIAIKDIMDLEGQVTTAGGVLLPDEPAAQDAEVVRRLKEAGAVILGKLNLHEYAWGGTTDNTHYGRCYNPWKPGYSPGGSSGGSGSAVVAGLCAAALGTDTLGSVRIPASYCGCVGFKPTNGRVSTRGVFPLSWSLDTVGPLANTVEDAVIVLNILSGHDPHDPYSAQHPYEPLSAPTKTDLSGMRFGVIADWTLAYDGGPLERVVAEAVAAAIDHLCSLGAERVDLPASEIYLATQAAFTIALADAAAIHKERLETAPDQIGPEVRTRLELGMSLGSADVADAFHLRQTVRQRFRELMKDVDCIVCPSTATPSHPFDPAMATGTAKYTSPFNVLGYPAISLPCGFTEGDLPIGLMVAAAPFHEQRAIDVAAAYEATTEWHTRRPDDTLLSQQQPQSEQA